jgi:hypothetical protein
VVQVTPKDVLADAGPGWNDVYAKLDEVRIDARRLHRLQRRQAQVEAAVLARRRQRAEADGSN